MITKKKDFIQDRKVQQQPGYGVKKWMSEIVVGYYKLKDGPKLKLKKHPNGDLEIYDGSKLLGSYSAAGNIYWGEPNTAGVDIFQNFRNLKNNPKAVELKNKIDESYFEIEEVVEDELEQREREFLNARGKMMAKIRDFFNKEVGEDGTFRLQDGNDVIEANADIFAKYILENFKAQFNKYGLTLANWVMKNIVSDRDMTTKRRLIMALNQLVKEDDDKYDENFNGLHPRDIMEEYAAAVKAAIRKEKEEINNMPVENKGYNIVRIKDEDHAKSFRKFLDSNGAWCITGGAYHNYVDPASGKAELFYVLLKDGYKDMPIPPRDKRESYDDYAKSMVMVSVRQDGSIRTVTSRYNHMVGTGDSWMNDVQLSNLIGKSIYKACPPLSSPLDLLRDIKIKGESYIKAPNSNLKREVKYYGGFLYIIENGQLVTDTWDSILKFNKIALVKKIKGDIDSETIGYVMIQKLLRSAEGGTDDTTEDFFIGMDLNLNMIYGPTKKGDIFTAIRETRKIISEGDKNESQS